MKRFLSILYTLATVLIVVGALFILQAENYGIGILSSGLGMNIIYRIILLNYNKLKQFKTYELIKCFGIVLMILSCGLIFTSFEQRYNLLIIAIVLDVILNFKEVKPVRK